MQHVTMSDPLHDTTPTRKTICATVPKEHSLNLTMPPAPAHVRGSQAFAIIRLEGLDNEYLVKAIERDTAFRPSYNLRYWDSEGQATPYGSYVSFRGYGAAIRAVVEDAGLLDKVIHCSEGFKS